MNDPLDRRGLSRRSVLLGCAACLTAPVPAGAQSFDPEAIGRWLSQDRFPDYPPIGDVTGSIDRTAPARQPAPPAAAPAQPGPGLAGEPPPPESPVDFPIQKVNPRSIPREFRRQVVDYDGPEWPGTIVVDTGSRHLYFVTGDGAAIRYGVGVGREGFAWAGEARIGRKARWPRWTPPAEMVARDPYAAPWANGMPGGPDNPLGARALYLFDVNGKDTLYRIHGTNQPDSIGKAMSSGCIRMLNEDVAELYLRAPIGAHVKVLNHVR